MEEIKKEEYGVLEKLGISVFELKTIERVKSLLSGFDGRNIIREQGEGS